MSNPNATPILGETDDTDEESNNFLVDRDDRQASAEAIARDTQERHQSLLDILKGDSKEDEDDDEEEDEDKYSSSKRSKTARSLRRLFKSRRASPDSVGASLEQPVSSTAAEETPAPSEAQAETEPQETDETIEAEQEFIENTPTQDIEESEEAGAEENDLKEFSQDEEVAFSHEEAASGRESAQTERIEAAESLAQAQPESTPEVQVGSPPPPPRPPQPTAPGSSGDGNGRGRRRFNPMSSQRTDRAYNNVPLSPNYAEETTALMEINRHEGGLGASIAFLAANFLSRGRDNRLSRRANEIAKRLKKTEHEVQVESDRVANRELEKREGERKRDSKLESIERSLAEATTPPEEARKAETITRPVALSEVIAASPLARKEVQTKAETAPEAGSKPTNFHERYEFEKQETPYINPDNFNEKAYERRHEVKDDAYSKTAPPYAAPPISLSTAPQPSQPTAEHRTLPEALTSLPAKARELVNDIQSGEMYKQSIRDGIMLGIVVTIVGLAGYFLLK